MNSTRLLANALAAGIPLDRARVVAGSPTNPTAESVLDVARSTGISRAKALELVADSEDESERLGRLATVGSASARQTARILTSLPAATVCASELFGFHALSVLVGSPLGWVCLVLGALFVWLGWLWMRRIRESVPRIPAGLGLALTLAAEMARSSSVSSDKRILLQSLADEWGTRDELSTVDSLRAMSREFGVPLANILDVESQRFRRDAQLDVELALELLPGRLLGPVGACLFPAFVLTTVIPIVIAMATDFVH